MTRRPVSARDVDCPTCAAPAGSGCVLGPRARDPQRRWQPVGYKHATRVQRAAEQDAAQRREQRPCRCGSRRPHLAGPRCGQPPASSVAWWWTEHPHSGPPAAERGAPTAPTT